MAKSFADKLLENGIIWVHSGIDNDEQDVLGQLILDIMSFQNKPEQLIQLFVTCRSESYTSCMAVYDVLQSLKNPIATFGVGPVDHYGTLLVASGKKGKRYTLRNSTIRLSQPTGFFVGTTLESDAVITANEVGENRKAFEALLAKHTGQPLEKIHQDVRDGLELTAEEAVAYGLVDHILG